MTTKERREYVLRTTKDIICSWKKGKKYYIDVNVNYLMFSLIAPILQDTNEESILEHHYLWKQHRTQDINNGIIICCNVLLNDKEELDIHCEETFIGKINNDSRDKQPCYLWTVNTDYHWYVDTLSVIGEVLSDNSIFSYL